MGRKKTTGLFKKRGIWQIDKQIFGQRIRLSTGTCDLNEAEWVLAKKIDDLRQSLIFGVRPKRTFREAAAYYLKVKEKRKSSLKEDERWINVLNPFIGDLTLEAVHMGSLQSYIDKRKRDGVKNRTINGPLQVVRHILNLASSVFIIPKGYVKNREHRLVVLNNTAKAVVERMRGIDEHFVFTCLFRGKRKPMTSMNSTAWKKARLRVGLSQVRVHDLKHTFGRRLRAAGVGLEDRQDLLGHKSARITTHYSAVEIQQLIEAANRVCERKASTPTLTLLRCQNKIPTISPPGNMGKLKLVK